MLAGVPRPSLLGRDLGAQVRTYNIRKENFAVRSQMRVPHLRRVFVFAAKVGAHTPHHPTVSFIAYLIAGAVTWTGFSAPPSHNISVPIVAIFSMPRLPKPQMQRFGRPRGRRVSPIQS